MPKGNPLGYTKGSYSKPVVPYNSGPGYPNRQAKKGEKEVTEQALDAAFKRSKKQY